MRDNNYPGELILFGSIAGAASALLKSIVHHVFVWVGLAGNFYGELQAYFTHGHLQVESFSDWIFSVIGDMTIGGLMGIILVFWLKISRKRYHWWIGFGYGVGIWLASLAFGNIAGIIEADMTTPWALFAHLLAMLTFGLLVVLFSRIWSPLRDRLEVEQSQEIEHIQTTYQNTASITPEFDMVNPSWSKDALLKATKVMADSLKLEWQPASDNAGHIKYSVMVNDVFVGDTDNTMFIVQNLEPGTSYTCSIVAEDKAGNRMQSQVKKVRTRKNR